MADTKSFKENHNPQYHNGFKEPCRFKQPKNNVIQNPSSFHQALQKYYQLIFSYQNLLGKIYEMYHGLSQKCWFRKCIRVVKSPAGTVEPRERYYCSRLVSAGDDTTIPSRQVPNGDRFATIARRSLANLCLSAYSCLFALCGLQ